MPEEAWNMASNTQMWTQFLQDHTNIEEGRRWQRSGEHTVLEEEEGRASGRTTRAIPHQQRRTQPAKQPA